MFIDQSQSSCETDEGECSNDDVVDLLSQRQQEVEIIINDAGQSVSSFECHLEEPKCIEWYTPLNIPYLSIILDNNIFLLFSAFFFQYHS